jgi:hypothetical protein
MPTKTATERAVPRAGPEPDLGRRDYARSMRRVALWLVGLGLAARLVRYAVNAPIWGDEAMLGHNLLHRDFAGLTGALDRLQVAPVLFLWVERAVVLVLGSSEWALRLVPFLAGLAALLAFWDFARRVVSPTAAALAVGTLAVARWPVFMSATLKPYSCDLLWSAVLLALAVRWRQWPDRLWPLALLAAVVPVALGSSFPSVFVAGGVALYLLPAVWRHPDRRARALFAAYGLLMLGAFAVEYWLTLRAQATPQGAALAAYMNDYWSNGFPPAAPPAFLRWLAATHTGRLMAFPIGDAGGLSTVSFLVFLAGVWVSWRSGRRALLVLCLAPFALNFAAAVAHRYPYAACCRLSQHLAPAICLMIGVGWAALLEWLAPRLRLRRRWVGAGALLLAAFALGQMVFDVASPANDRHSVWCRQIGREIGRHLEPGDVLVVGSLTGERLESFDWYLDRLGYPVTWDRPPAPGPEARRAWLVTLTANRSGEGEAADAVAALGPGWSPVARTAYLVQPDLAIRNYLQAVVLCVARAGDPREYPVLESSP